MQICYSQNKEERAGGRIRGCGVIFVIKNVQIGRKWVYSGLILPSLDTLYVLALKAFLPLKTRKGNGDAGGHSSIKDILYVGAFNAFLPLKTRKGKGMLGVDSSITGYIICIEGILAAQNKEGKRGC